MNQEIPFCTLLEKQTPSATAQITGNKENPSLNGTVQFYETPYQGILILAEFFGLPSTPEKTSAFFGFHIHEYGDCSLPFDKTGMHYNPSNQLHPFHAGDLPPLLGNYGYAFQMFYDVRFKISEIIGRSVIIHAQADDFTTQPSGNSGEKIGCGIIEK